MIREPKVGPMRRSLLSLSSFPSMLALFGGILGCSDVNFTVDKQQPVVVEPGSISGRVCDPSGRTWLPDAMAYVNLVDDAGVVYEIRTAYSDQDGRWLLDALPGEKDYTVYVQYGPDLLTQESVYVASNAEVELEEPECFDPLSLDVAVVTGDYDDFNEILNQMGFANYVLVDGLDPTVIGDFLASPEELQKYDIIFFNGGFVEEGVIYNGENSSTYLDNLRNYVTGGGTLYASDWAYDVVEIGWPDAADFVGADEVPDDAQKGDYASVTAAVSDQSLSDFLGTQYVPILYDLPVWPPVQAVTTGVSVHLTASVPYSEGMSEYALAQVPILFSFNSGEGKVVFSTFRVARNSSDEMLKTLQYMMYQL